MLVKNYLFIIFAESSNLHVRRKRIIDPTWHRNQNLTQHVPYIVNIIIDGIPHCAGSILLAHIILTAAHCVNHDLSHYRVLSGSQFANQGIPHNITRKILHPNYGADTFTNDLALLIIYPPINFYNLFNQIIEVNRVPVQPNTFGIVSGWGCSEITS